MQINYNGLNGKRSKITLSDELAKTWLRTKPEFETATENERAAAIREIVEETPEENGKTFVSSVEYFMFGDIRDYMTKLEIRGFELAQEVDGQ
jgi:hypothetical protein